LLVITFVINFYRKTMHHRYLHKKWFLTLK